MVDTRKLEKVQGRVLCAVFNNKTVAYEQLLIWADIPSLENWRFQDILTLRRTRKFIPLSGTMGGGWMEPLLRVFDMLQYFETILPLVESL